jgi:hypothetical protein
MSFWFLYAPMVASPQSVSKTVPQATAVAGGTGCCLIATDVGGVSVGFG